jgi:hypothetical protein
LALETVGALNGTERFDWAGDDSRKTVTETGEFLIEPADTLATKELSEAHILDSAELLIVFNTAD